MNYRRYPNMAEILKSLKSHPSDIILSPWQCRLITSFMSKHIYVCSSPFNLYLCSLRLIIYDLIYLYQKGINLNFAATCNILTMMLHLTRIRWGITTILLSINRFNSLVNKLYVYKQHTNSHLNYGNISILWTHKFE